MTDSTPPIFDAVDALLEAVATGAVLPPPPERIRLRRAAGLTEAAVAQALKVRPTSVTSWEAGRSEPAGEKFDAYRRLLEGLAAKFPAPAPRAPAAAPPMSGPAAPPPAAPHTPAPDDPTPSPAAPAKPARPAQQAPAGPAEKKPTHEPTATASDSDPRFTNGPLLVLDGDGNAHAIGGLVLTCPATTIAALVEWTLEHARVGAPRLHPSGKEDDPLVVLTAPAAAKLGLPPELEDRRGLRLPDNHPVVKHLTKAKWQLTRRGFGPWARIYRPVDGGRRACVQLAVLPWGALDARDWGKEFTTRATDGTAHPAEIAQALTNYASLLLNPRGSGATCGIALMEALRPPTRALQDKQTGTWSSGAMPGSLPIATDPSPVAAPDEHPLVAALYPRTHRRTADQVIDEEAYEWVRDPELLSDQECALPWAVGIDVNMAFGAAANRLLVGLGEAVHLTRPQFDRKLPGEWLVDLSAITLDARLPSPFTPSGATPTGPAWYSTPTLAYAHELVDTLGLGVRITPLEGWLRPDAKQLTHLGVPVPPAPWQAWDAAQLERLGLAELTPRARQFLETVPRFANGPYLDPWYTRIRDAYMTVMAQLGVTAGMEPDAFLAAMACHKEQDPALAAVLTAIKSTVKGGVGKLRERPQGTRHQLGEPWPALRRPTWSPHIRAAIISSARVNMHRKMLTWATKADLWPLAVLSDCAVYPSPGPTPLDFAPTTPDGKPLSGGFRLGVSPGMVKLEGAQPLLWAVQLMDQQLNPARHIKGTDAATDGE